MRAAPEITLKYNNSYAKLSKNRYTNISVIVTIKKIISFSGYYNFFV
jgi:hypothetical protein